MSSESETSSGFQSLNLPADLLRALSDVGYETPTPIQSEAIPCLLESRDLVVHAPTGIGKAAAFALPCSLEWTSTIGRCRCSISRAYSSGGG